MACRFSLGRWRAWSRRSRRCTVVCVARQCSSVGRCLFGTLRESPLAKVVDRRSLSVASGGAVEGVAMKSLGVTLDARHTLDLLLPGRLGHARVMLGSRASSRFRQLLCRPGRARRHARRSFQLVAHGRRHVLGQNRGRRRWQRRRMTERREPAVHGRCPKLRRQAVHGRRVGSRRASARLNLVTLKRRPALHG